MTYLGIGLGLEELDSGFPCLKMMTTLPLWWRQLLRRKGEGELLA